eukprot:scaffold25_cov342-Pavlova_lutheri.AAC.72
MLETQRKLPLQSGWVYFDAEVGIVKHAHDVPGYIFRLRVHRLVPGPNADFLALQELGYVNLKLPKAPAPVLPIGVRVLWMVQLG